MQCRWWKVEPTTTYHGNIIVVLNNIADAFHLLLKVRSPHLLDIDGIYDVMMMKAVVKPLSAMPIHPSSCSGGGDTQAAAVVVVENEILNLRGRSKVVGSNPER